MLPDKSPAQRSRRLHRRQGNCECASLSHSLAHIRSTPCSARRFPGGFFRLDSLGFSLTRREVSTTPGSGWVNDWSASVLACISFVKATLQPGRLRSSQPDPPATADGTDLTPGARLFHLEAALAV